MPAQCQPSEYDALTSAPAKRSREPASIAGNDGRYQACASETRAESPSLSYRNARFRNIIWLRRHRMPVIAVS